MRYIVKPEDLKGEIANFPIEVVQRMVDCQVEQKNYADVSVFQKSKKADLISRGFGWSLTKEGYEFWQNVIMFRKFGLFFERYSLYTAIAEAVKSVVNADTSVEIEEKDGTVVIRKVEKKEQDLPIDYPVMVNDRLDIDSDWKLRYYAGDGWTCECNAKKSDNTALIRWNYIIPFDKFNPNDIEESLKHNIVK